MDRENAYIMTFTGKMLNPFYPKEELICIEDIAHSLSMQCRFNGHVKRFYSIAEHCMYTALVLRELGYPAKVQLLGLLHDASEAYLSDIPAPVKEFLNEYREIEFLLNTAIYSKLVPYCYGLTKDELDAITMVDKELALLEGRKLIGEAEWNRKKTQFDVNFDTLGELSPKEIEKAFIVFYKALREEAKLEQTTNRARS